MMMKQAAHPLETKGSWVRPRPPDESLLSKSLGTSSLSRTASMKRSTSEISSISYSGYLLKRSNLPHQDSYQKLSALPLDNPLDTVSGNYFLEPQSHIVAEILVEDRDVKTDAPANKPQHLMTQENATTQEETKEEKSPVEQSIDRIASFFGMILPTTKTEKEKEEPCVSPTRQPLAPHLTSCPATPPQPIGTRSAPLSVTSKLQSQMPPMPFDDDVLRFLHRGDSAPSVMNPLAQAASVDSAMPPADFVDPKDGHIWRAKYCVLEDGILYFYRNASDGESQEAKTERAKSLHLYETSPNATPEDLSKSPTPRKLINSLARQGAVAAVIYEKRVFLDRVGAVRSADHEYGECSFELLAVEDDDVTAMDMFSTFETDKLVLRARNADEMREWLFQFHRYLATLMKNIIETAVESGGLTTVPLGDIHHPSFAMTHFPPHELGLRQNGKYSPRSMLQSGAHFPASLSHGHGQSSALRRKRASSKSKGTPSSTPSGSPLHPNFDLSNETSSRLTPPQGTRVQLPQSVSPMEKEVPPEFSRPPETCPETERPPPAPRGGKYVPPHLRNNGANQNGSQTTFLKTGRSLSDLMMEPSESRLESSYIRESAPSPVNHYGSGDAVFEMSLDEPQVDRVTHKEERPIESGRHGTSPFRRGGCADPQVVVGSILDPMFKPRSASKLRQVHTEDYGSFGGGSQVSAGAGSTTDTSLQWEIGAVSKCGVRDSNEDSYLVASNLTKGFESLPTGSSDMPLWRKPGSHHPGLFCIFDGHNGNHVARFAAEKLPHFLLEEARIEVRAESGRNDAEATEEVLRNAIGSLDDAFCNLCMEDGRDWESGATAMIALVAHEHLTLASLGDCRGVLCRSLDDSDVVGVDLHKKNGWTMLDLEMEEAPVTFSCFLREVNRVHSPSLPDERERIEKANGWVTIETEIPIGQLQRMDFYDEDVVGILKRHYLDRYSDRESSNSAPHRTIEISRVCGDLAVSRALGDHDYKSAFNTSFENGAEDLPSEWHSPMLFLPFPDDHSRRFRGDLVSPIPELQRHKLAEKGVFNEFLLLACDGLWDVMDPDDAIRVTRGLLYEKKWEAKRAAARLAELAIHLGSSDNVTVILVRFFKDSQDENPS